MGGASIPLLTIETIIVRMFADPQVNYVHVHHARQGCYFGRIDRT
ncbi:MAG: DUF1203 domain-containing protein [Janthinobacterium lividum]